MRIENEGIILHLQPFGDSSFIVKIFSKNYGCLKGLLHKKKNQNLAIGTHLFFKYARKIEKNLGNFQIEKINNIPLEIFFNKIKLLILHSALSLLNIALPENEINKKLFLALQNLEKQLIEKSDIQELLQYYIKFELQFLFEMGFGLHLDSCPVFGSQEKLKFISPKTGRAVSEKAGINYQKKLFVLPKFFHNQPTDLPDLINCLQITEFFIQNRIINEKKMSTERKLLIKAILHEQDLCLD